ncbi:MAG: D-alanyl-D-alanine carboxypeptidase/D-alanyl-D-alanine-endopeptidase [Saprospiraceae bacterium]|nr:D-alanyl-D-alanine carboxypeptidase/D-alanyl-D-alanine-endopeptidase [Saprospiraceae bacterium]
MNKIHILFLLLLCLQLQIFGQFNRNAIQSSIDKFAEDKDLSGSSMSICLMNASTGAIIASYDKQRKLIPASTQKLITCATALKYLGENYIFSTPFQFIGRIIQDSIFSGDLIIQGVGDPSFGSGNFKEANTVSFIADTIYSILKNECITEIHGKIIVRSDFINDIPENPEWLFYDIGNYYGAGIYGFNVLDNSAYLTIEKGSNSEYAEITEVYPSELRSQFSNKIKVQSNSNDNDELFVIGSSNCSNLKLCGVVSSSVPFKTQIKSAIPDPGSTYELMLKNQLERRGIKVVSQKNNRKSNYKYEWFRNYSPPLSEMIRYALKTSNNLYCESFIHILGQQWFGSTERDKAIQTLMNIWNEKLDSDQQIKLVDGSGLSRKNRISAESMCKLLNSIQSIDGAPVILNLISDSSTEGSLASQFSGSNTLKGELLLKSGSMEGIRAYAGYLRYPNAPLLSFCLFINFHECNSKLLTSKIAKVFINIDNSFKPRG